MGALGFPAPDHATKNDITVSGNFTPNGAGAIDNTLNKGRGFIVTRTGVGTADLLLDVGPAAAVEFVEWTLWSPALTNARYETRLPVQGTDGRWTIPLVLTDLTNTTPVAKEWPASTSRVAFKAILQRFAQAVP